MTAQEGHSSTLQSLHAGVLINRGRVVRVLRKILRIGVSSAGVEGVPRRRLACRGVVDREPRPDLALTPDEIIEVKHVRWPMQRGRYLDLADRNTESEMKTIQGVLYAVQKLPVPSSNDVEDLFNAGRVSCDLVEFQPRPVFGGVNKLRHGSLGAGKRRCPGGRADKCASAQVGLHCMLVFHRSLKLHERTALDGGDPDIPLLFALRSSRGDAPAIDELGIAQLDRLVGWIDCAGDALAPSMAVVEVDSDVPGGLPVGADVGDGGKRGVAVGGAAGKPEDFVVKSA